MKQITKSIGLHVFVMGMMLMGCLPVRSQNARFSQPWNAPMMLNPALCGNFDGQIRTNLLSSWQKSDISNITHQYVAVDGQVKKDYIENYWGFGISGYQYGNDILGVAKNTSPIDARFLAASLAYHINLNPEEDGQWISFGMQLASAQGRVDESRGAYDKEIGGGGFRFNNLVPFGTKTGLANYMDMNVGATYTFSGDLVTAEMGVSLYHLFAPKTNLIGFDLEYRQRRRGVISAAIGMDFGGSIILFRNIFWQEGLYYNSTNLDAQQVVNNTMGVELQSKVKKGAIYFDAGLYSRSMKTIMPYTSIHFGEAINLRLSYEMPLRSTPDEKGVTYTAKRMELGLNYFVFAKKKTKSLFGNEEDRHRGSEARFW